MSLDKISVLLAGAGLIAFIYWFFFGKKNTVAVASGEITIEVDGGYKPDIIKIKRGEKTKLLFLRRDPSTCLEEIVIPAFKVREYLPLNMEVAISLKPKEFGEYGMHCGMNMYHGKIIVE